MTTCRVMNEASQTASPHYKSTDLTMIGNRIIVTCSDAEEAGRAEQEALSIGLDALNVLSSRYCGSSRPSYR
ncbi:MAG: hypothetical protein AAGJ80_07000, partial [Cyanobacteria bacterium J06553_1]